MDETHFVKAPATPREPGAVDDRPTSDSAVSGEQDPGARRTSDPAVDTTLAVQPPGERRTLWHGLPRLGRSAARVVVLGLLAALGYWGHRNDWKMPAFSELTGHPKAAPADWCDAHGVPEEICIACRADLMPKGQLYGWCKEHGVAECILEHPELTQLKQSPTISPADFRRARDALAMNDRPENNPLCKMHLRRIQFASREAADQAGIDIGLVERGRVVETIRVVGEVRYDPTRVSRLASRAAGTVWSVAKNVGEPVRQGDVLALIDAAAAGQAKAELQQAVAQWNLHEQTVKRVEGLGDAVPRRRLLEAKAECEQSEAAVRRVIQTLMNLGLPVTLEELRGKSGRELVERIEFLGLPPAVSQRFDPRQSTANLLPVIAPRDGVVATRDVVAGEVVEATRPLFTVVDNRQMWLLLDVPLEDARLVTIGQGVQFRPDGSRRDHTGKIGWISTRVDADTRTVKIRAELSNEDGTLRDQSFGAGQVVLRDERDAIVAPQEAIHWEGCCHVAFVRDKNWFTSPYKVIHTRSVRPGVAANGTVEIIAGLLPGEVVVTEGSAVLRAELLKGNLGAG